MVAPATSDPKAEPSRIGPNEALDVVRVDILMSSLREVVLGLSARVSPPQPESMGSAG